MNLFDPITKAILIRGHLILHQQGMRHSRLTRRQLLNKATVLTGKFYENSRKGTAKAVADLSLIAGAR
jgi:hypothetical protein